MNLRPIALALLLLATPLAAKTPPAKPAAPVVAEPAVKIVKLRAGKGAVATLGQQVTVRYTGWLANGAKKGIKFDSTDDHGGSFDFGLGEGRVIEGWDRGVVGMKIGEKRRLIVPPELGYGAEGAGGVIPPNATLIFEIELLKVQ